MSALDRPRLAWPTLLLWVVALGVWATAGVLGATGALAWPWVTLLATIGAYLCFTPMHDAVHQAVGRSAALNAVVGRAAAIPLVAPYLAFRWVHLEHHKHTNDRLRDPDFWSGRGPALLLPFRWLSQDLHYYAVYLPRLHRRPRAEAIETVLGLVLLYGTAVVLMVNGHLAWVLLAWLLPARLAIACLAFGFDFLPHYPYPVTQAQDRYRATCVMPKRWLTPLLVAQNYHLVHHLYPAVPFYRYGTVWWERREELLARGARVRE